MLALLPETQAWQEMSVKEHEAIVNALARRDQNAAYDLMYEHVKGTSRSVRALLKSLDAKSARRARRA